MTILDESKCEACKKLKNTKSIVLNKILPEVITNKIVSYNCCYYCGMMRKKEQENKTNEHLSKTEKQIQYFKRTKLSRYNEYDRSIVREINQLKIIIDRGNNPFKNVLKSYVRNCYRTITFQFCMIIRNLHDKKWLTEFVKNNSNILTMKYSYDKNTYVHKWLCKLIVYEYLNDLMSYDKQDINNGELKDDLNDVFDDYSNYTSRQNPATNIHNKISYEYLIKR